MSTRDELARTLKSIEAQQTSFEHSLSFHLKAADDLLAAGYGKLADAWDAGHESGFWNGRESAGNVEGLLIGVEHARERNPYGSES